MTLQEIALAKTKITFTVCGVYDQLLCSQEMAVCQIVSL